MRLVFMGTPAFSLPTFEALVAAGHDIAAVYTRAPKPAGRRGLAERPSPVHAAAERHGIAVLTPKTLRSEEAARAFAAHRAEVAIVVAYGLLLPPAILALPAHGCLNLHASLLPRWRGAAPIQRALMAGDRETGIAVMLMEEGLDTGPIALEARLPLPPDTDAGAVHDALAGLGARLAVRALADLPAGRLGFRPQAPDGVLYAKKIDKAEAAFDWTRPAETLHNQVRGLSPAPGAFFEAEFGRGLERVKVLRTRLSARQGVPGLLLDDGPTIACGAGALQLETVQRAGRAPMAAADFLRGTSLRAGDRLPCPATV